MSTEHDRWLDTLAGHVPARPAQAAPGRPDEDDDLDTAAWLRDKLTQPGGAACDPEPRFETVPEPLDEATLRRVMNGLEARGTFKLAAQRAAAARASIEAAPVQAASTPAPSAAPARPAATPPQASVRRPQPSAWGGLAPALARTGAWLQGGWGMSLTALVAVLAVAVLVTQAHRPIEADTQAYTKGSGQTVSQRVTVRQPDQEAARLVALLTRLGVAAQVQLAGPDRVVHATLPVEALKSFEAALQQEGISVPRDGRLAVQFAASSP